MKYDFEKMEFNIERAKKGQISVAFIWEETPQGVDFWELQNNFWDANGRLTTTATRFLEEMIEEYENQWKIGDKFEFNKFEGEVLGFWEDKIVADFLGQPIIFEKEAMAKDAVRIKEKRVVEGFVNVYSDDSEVIFYDTESDANKSTFPECEDFIGTFPVRFEEDGEKT